MTHYFCIEILGENSFHPVLLQSGWSGKDYLFHYNPATQSHVRAYGSIEEYRAERVDMHKAENIWPLLGNLLPREALCGKVFASGAPNEDATVDAKAKAPARKSRREGGA